MELDRGEHQEIKISLDVMSGDKSPFLRISTAVKLLRDRRDVSLYLVGDSSFIQSSLSDLADVDLSRVSIVHASKTVVMGEHPARVLRSKRDSSMWKALELVAEGKASACVSSGCTGSLMVMGRHLLNTYPGIDRPAIAACIPSENGSSVLLDIGANVNSSCMNLYQFSIMGSQLAACLFKLDRPRVALLNVGTEELKGNEQIRLTHKLLQNKSNIHYIGYIEGDSIFSGIADVIICDGFSGNIAIKTAEGVAGLVGKELLSVFNGSWWWRLLGFVISPALKRLSRRIDPVLYNGAIFLGLQGIVVKSHGGADDVGFYHAVCQAISEVENGIADILANGVEELLAHSDAIDD